jgi:hypothetical protein
MKAENPNSVLWLSCWRPGVSRTSKNLFSCLSVFDLVCWFAGYCGVILVSWFRLWSAILVAQWIFFISCVNHGSGDGLVRSFWGSEGLWRRNINMNLVKVKKADFWQRDEAKFLVFFLMRRC